MGTPLWLWMLCAMLSILLLAALVRNKAASFETVPWAFLPLLLCLLWPLAGAAAESFTPLDYTQIDTGPCPGVVAYKEMRETSRKSVQSLTAAFIANGWSNITVEERGHDSFWASTYSVVAARCNQEDFA